MANKQEITQALMGLQHLPNSPIHDMNVAQIVAQYEADLGDIPGEILGAAVIHYRTSSSPFFPTSGQLREKAVELLLLAMNIPTAGQAWAQVINANRFVDSVWCEEGARLFHGADGKTGGEYWEALLDYKLHMENCTACTQGGFKEVYDHPVVEQIVKELGGSDTLLNGDISVCRSHFIRGYNELVQRHVKLQTMAKPVREAVRMIEAGQTILPIKQLAGGMRK